MIKGCDGVCRWHENGSSVLPGLPSLPSHNGKALQSQQSDDSSNKNMVTIRSRFSKIKQDDWDRIFKKGKYATNDTGKLGERQKAQLPSVPDKGPQGSD